MALVMAAVKIFENENLLFNKFQNELFKISEKSIKENGHFTLAISGGSIIKYLSEITVKNPTDWFIFFADERDVPLTHQESNYFQASKFLKQFNPNNVHAKNPSLDVKESASDYENRLNAFFENNVSFDLIILGVGPDGHTASLFPNHDTLKSNKLVVYEQDSPKLPKSRISLGLRTINSCKNIFFVASGIEKKDILLRIFENDDNLPVNLVKGNITWFVDRLAALEIAHRITNEKYLE